MKRTGPHSNVVARSSTIRTRGQSRKEREASYGEYRPDVHKVNSQVCIVGENGEVIEERRIHTEGIAGISGRVT